MGVDLSAVIGHKYKFQEIIRLQFRIESNERLKALYWWEVKESTVLWSDLISEQSLEKFWEYNERQEPAEGEDIFQYDNSLRLPVFFGELIFHRHIVELDGFGLRLWTLGVNDEACQRILQFYGCLAEILDEQVVIYYGDSWASSNWIGDWTYGRTINQILNKIEEKGQGQIPTVEESINKEHLFVQRIR